LEEATNASLLIHIIDASDFRRDEKIADVMSVLAEIGAQDVPIIHVYNKIDACTPIIEPHVTTPLADGSREAWVSARAEQGMSLLIRAIAEKLEGEQLEVKVALSASEGKHRAQLYATGQVLSESFDDNGLVWLTLRVSPAQWAGICQDSCFEFKEQLASKAFCA
jgi:GTP-binding protein HflX